MPLTTRQRTSIFQKLVPTLGEEDADALMAQFPAAEHDALVTRGHLRAEMAILRSDLRAELAELRIAMQTEIAELRTATQADIAELRAEMAELRTETFAHINRAMFACAGFTSAAVVAATGVLAAIT